MDVILASSSPRRAKLLTQLFDDFKIIPPKIDESKFPVETLSTEKCKKVALMHKSSLVIAADTFILLDGEVIGKPENDEAAFKMLKLLSGKTHQVITYYTFMMLSEHLLFTSSAVSNVTFNDLSDETIKNYIAASMPLEKAGGYGLQENDEFHLIKEVDGSLTNVIGLPIEMLKIDLNRLGFKTK